MAISNFVQEVWSAATIANLRKSLVARSVATTRWEGEIRNQGDTVRIQRPAALTAGAYSGTVSYQVPTSGTQSLLIDQANYSAFTVTDIDKVQANVELVSMYTQESAYSLAALADKYVMDLVTAAGLNDREVTLDLSSADPDDWTDVYASMVQAGEFLDVADAPREGRFVVASPRLYAAMLQDDSFVRATDFGDAVRVRGAVGEINGFQVVRSNNVNKRVIAGSVAGSADRLFYGVTNAIAYADQITEMEAMRAETAFSDLVRVLHVYGARIVQPELLGRLDVTTLAATP